MLPLRPLLLTMLLMNMQALGLTRAIGISDFDVAQLGMLKAPQPALHQHSMTMTKWQGEPLLDHALEHGYAFEAYSVMRGCPFTDQGVLAAAAAHNVSASQVRDGAAATAAAAAAAAAAVESGSC